LATISACRLLLLVARLVLTGSQSPFNVHLATLQVFLAGFRSLAENHDAVPVGALRSNN
jgi:hypothetical protein